MSGLARGAGTGASVFLAWAICRELDPDHDFSAFISAGMALAGSLIFFPPSYLVLFWILLSVRMINRTTGLAAGTGDSMVLIILGGLAVFTRQNWIIGLATGVYFLLDAILPEGRKIQFLFAAVQFIIVAIAGYILDPAGFDPWLSDFLLVIIIAAVLLALPFIYSYKDVVSTGDHTGTRLSPARLMTGQISVIILLLLLVWLEGNSGFQALLPVWTAFFSAAVFWFGRVLISPIRQHM